jgi:aspartyl aminopeptidase
MKFLWEARTERERVLYAANLADKANFQAVEIGKNINTLQPGDKLYYINRHKNIALAVIGKESITDRMNLLGGHLDTPRIDIKMHPLYEDDKTGVALFKTHYYGGVKKYQWLSFPLHLTGIISKKDGTNITVDVGRDPNDPVFMIPDLLPHLAKDVQGDRKGFDIVKAEEMNALVGALPVAEKESKEKFKMNILKILNEKYDITEADLQSADLSLVSGVAPRFVGFDKGLIGGAGQDDGVCSYTALRAILDYDGIPEHTIMVGLFDKEEIGSNGNTGAQSFWLEHVINDVMIRSGVTETNTNLFLSLSHLMMLSADVSAPMDPSFPSVHDPKNTGALGKGPIIEKYTGSGGKYGSSDAGAEMMGYIRRILDDSNAFYQIASLGAVDAGGGGTIAKFVAEHFNADVLDVGTPVLDMHSPFEITHIADVYDTYLVYSAFLKS